MKILLVEDTRTMAVVLASRLTSFGHEVTIAEHGQIAVDRFQQSNYDLILMDIEMPVMNGFEATRQIREYEANQQWAWTPILFLTASDTEQNLVMAIEVGGDDFLSKTVPEDVLKAKMKAMGRIAALRGQLATANAKLEDLASRDGLTGLFNRRKMDLKLDAAWAEAVRKGQAFGLLMIDIDNFKKYNDHYGHQQGDDCLMKVAATIRQVVEATNENNPGGNMFPARYGGEEFAVILPDVTRETYEGLAHALVETIRQLKIEHSLNEPMMTVTASIGGNYQTVAQGRIADAFRAADVRLYRAKSKGRNRAELWDK